VSIWMNVHNPNLARHTQMNGQVKVDYVASAPTWAAELHGRWNENTQADGFRLSTSGGGTITGEMRIYGYQNSPGDPGPSGYSDESARDAIGAALVDTTTIDWTIDDALNTISAVVPASAPLTTPTIASFVNATHNHSNAAGGGTLPATSITALEAVWLETLSPSGASSSSSSAIFTSTYANYLVVARLSLNTANASLSLRLRASGADASGANYYWALNTNSSAATASAQGGAGSTSWTIGNAPGAGITWSDYSLWMVLNSPQLTDETLMNMMAGGRLSTPSGISYIGGGFYNATTAYDAITIFPSSGTITGTIRIYGLRNS